MAFSDHKIAAFAHKITDLPDQPNLPADELKARFDSSPEELRQAHNALCDDADRLDDRVSGIIAETFGDTISKSMLSDELQDEIDAKAEAADLTAETTARESADNALSTRVSTAESKLNSQATQIAQKCQVYVGTYVGNADASTGIGQQVISLGFTPKAVLVLRCGADVSTERWSYGGLALSGYPVTRGVDIMMEVVNGGFKVYSGFSVAAGIDAQVNSNGDRYYYLAFR